MIQDKKRYTHPVTTVELLFSRLMEDMTLATSGLSQEEALAPERKTPPF